MGGGGVRLKDQPVQRLWVARRPEGLQTEGGEKMRYNEWGEDVCVQDLECYEDLSFSLGLDHSPTICQRSQAE